MKISSAEEYGLRCLLQLAKKEDIPISAEEIANNEDLSSTYTEKVLQILSKKGFVRSIRGAKGGYILTRTPDEIMVGHVIKAMNKGSVEKCSTISKTNNTCIHISNCSLRPLWKSIFKYIYDVLDKTSLADLMKNEKAVSSDLSEHFKNLQEIKEITKV